MTKKRRRRGDEPTGRRYLVTGGAGFIGSYLSEKLLSEGHEVVVIDDLSTGRLENIRHLEGNRRFDYVIESVANEPLLQNVIGQVDAVFHLAAGVGVMSVVHSPVHTIEDTLYATEIVLHCASQAGDKKVLITSSSEVYGKGTKVPFNEDDDMLFGPTTKSRWSYGCSKAIDEFLGLAYAKEMKLPVVIVRLFNTVGPRQLGDYGMVLPRFVSQALRGGPVTVFGDGEQTRCFVHVTDVVDALCELMHSPEAEGQVVNVGSDEEITINALAERVRARVNPEAEIRHVPYEEAYEEGFEDLRRRVPDLSRVRKLIGFKPTRSLDEIIDAVATEFRMKKQKIDEL
ncbi:MAG: nucleoside-diphosphate sugar epimerase [Planctomycetes bacterium DG_58]|nr:MAG: nucleoside-diphosphate sugar epimerase [Planctomycetes bacterium DG_58]